MEFGVVWLVGVRCLDIENNYNNNADGRRSIGIFLSHLDPNKGELT